MSTRATPNENVDLDINEIEAEKPAGKPSIYSHTPAFLTASRPGVITRDGQKFIDYISQEILNAFAASRSDTAIAAALPDITQFFKTYRITTEPSKFLSQLIYKTDSSILIYPYLKSALHMGQITVQFKVLQLTRTRTVEDQIQTLRQANEPGIASILEDILNMPVSAEEWEQYDFENPLTLNQPNTVPDIRQLSIDTAILGLINDEYIKTGIALSHPDFRDKLTAAINLESFMRDVLDYGTHQGLIKKLGETPLYFVCDRFGNIPNAHVERAFHYFADALAWYLQLNAKSNNAFLALHSAVAISPESKQRFNKQMVGQIANHILASNPLAGEKNPGEAEKLKNLALALKHLIYELEFADTKEAQIKAAERTESLKTEIAVTNARDGMLMPVFSKMVFKDIYLKESKKEEFAPKVIDEIAADPNFLTATQGPHQLWVVREDWLYWVEQMQKSKEPQDKTQLRLIEELIAKWKEKNPGGDYQSIFERSHPEEAKSIKSIAQANQSKESSHKQASPKALPFETSHGGIAGISFFAAINAIGLAAGYSAGVFLLSVVAAAVAYWIGGNFLKWLSELSNPVSQPNPVSKERLPKPQGQNGNGKSRSSWPGIVTLSVNNPIPSGYYKASDFPDNIKVDLSSDEKAQATVKNFILKMNNAREPREKEYFKNCILKIHSQIPRAPFWSEPQYKIG